jgi:hypothetical protein
MTPPVVNYARMARLQAAEIPPPTRWDMTNSTKFCVGLMIIVMVILFNRWKNKSTQILYR